MSMPPQLEPNLGPAYRAEGALAHRTMQVKVAEVHWIVLIVDATRVAAAHSSFVGWYMGA